MTRWPESESDIGRVLIPWLETNRWEVWQEVQPARFDRVADIVARRGSILWVIEMKRSLSLSLLEQAERWNGLAHVVSVAVPEARHAGLSWRVAEWIGVGVLSVSQYAVDVKRAPRLNRKPLRHWMDRVLTEEQRAHGAVAGNGNGDRWTPFAQTCRYVASIVADNPGISMRDMVSQLKGHHYASDATARSCLRKWIDAGTIRGVRAEYEGRKIRLMPNPDR